MKKLLITLSLCSMVLALRAQMWNGVDTLYGNEWIDFDAQYLKLSVGEDGIYRLPSAALEAHIPASVNANQLHLYHMGELVPLYVSTEGPLGTDDFLEFFGKRNRNELDNYLLDDPENHFHPDYSFFSDTSAYFLTWKTTENPVRMVDIDNDISNAPPKEEYYIADYIYQVSGAFTKKSVDIGTAEVQQSYFSDTEGWGSGYGGGTLRTFSLNIKEPYTTGPETECTVQFACRAGNHHQVVRFNGVQYVDDSFSGFFGRKHTFTLPTSTITTPSTMEFVGIENSLDRQSVSYMHLRYPRTFKFSGETSMVFTVEGNGNEQYIEVPNFNSGSNLPRAYDVTNGYRLTVIKEGGIIKFVLPPATGPRQLALVNVVVGIQEIQEVEPVSFVDFSAEPAQFIIIYNQLLAQPYNGTNWVQAYANYRQNESPNPLTTATAEIQQLYDQFAYGVNRHSISIRNFSHFLKKEWPDIRYFFIIGKGREYRHIRLSDDLALANGINFFVPTFGVPGADNLLFSAPNTPVPFAPVGRLAATTPADVKIYLNKVKAFENPAFNNQTIADQAWKKRIVHLGGGGDAFEQQLIRSHLEGMSSIIQNNTFGAEVTSFYKTSTDPIETTQTSQIKNLINSGVAILTFFGHSSPNIFDFNFDDPATYENSGKYPILFSMGCFSGQCHTDAFGIGERFVKADD
ncbi:MAG: hypothetical protein KDC44_15050, partial [Phaeodactylibacter sp.]|nr:hypothetical protein [Phaeodactylibacter sp.]